MGQHNALCRELGSELRKRREDAGLTLAEMGERFGWSKATIARIETGHRPIEPVDLAQSLGWCGMNLRQSHDMFELSLEAERAQGFWLNPQDDWLEDSLRSLIYHEATANSSTIYEPQLVHGLLQTP